MLKNRFSLLCLAVASSLTLTACDVVDAAYDETLNDNAPEIVIAGGFKIDIQGNAVPVEGYDNCSLNTLQEALIRINQIVLFWIEHVKKYRF